MASAGDSSSPADHRGLRRLLLLRREKPPERNPLIPSSSSPPPPPRSPQVGKKGSSFASAAFRGLGCSSASSSRAFAPAAAAAVRSSADWQGKRPRRRRMAKQKKKDQRSQAGGSDVWCAPGIPFAADASVDCVVSHHQMTGRGRPDSGRAQREARPSISRRGINQEQIPSFIGSPSDVEARYFGSDLLPPGHLRYMRGYHHSPGGLDEIMMFQTRLLFGGMDLYDQYRDWRLDVDDMSYEELLELGDRIGYVSTGLREEEIVRSLRKVKHSVFNASPVQFPPDIERKCCICQEEYKVDDEIGRLECGHSYHIYCIKQWLSQKNACPVCKTAVHKT